MSRHAAFAVFIVFTGAALSGCGLAPGGLRRGDGATLKPGWARLGRAAKSAALRTETWAPAAAALAVKVSGSDKQLSSWASRKTPVYGSQAGARRASNTLIGVSNALYWGSVLAAPGGPDAGGWFWAKAKLGAGGLAANAAAFQATLSLQKAAKRERPNGAGRSSFPSLHTAYAASQAVSAQKNFESLDVSPAGAALLRGGADAVPLAMAWARLEAKAHYPSDTLAAIALSSFISSFVSEAFLGESVTAGAAGKTAWLRWDVRF